MSSQPRRFPALKPLSGSHVRPELVMFFVLVAAVSLANGLSDNIYANFFKEVYQVSAFQRGLIEGPRELPGMLCALVIGSIGFLGDIRVAFIAQICALVGITMLGLFTPSFGLMLVFLFINSMGMHLFMPLQDAIGMSLAEPDKVGRRMGQMLSVRSAFSFLAGFVVFFGFRYGVFSFATPVKLVFLLAAGGFVCALVINGLLIRHVRPSRKAPQRLRLVFRRQYRYYYLLTILKGVQKQIALVYGTWVIVDLLMKKADTLAMLMIVVGFISIFFMHRLGHWSDRHGIKSMMYFDALTFIIIYVIYGVVVWGISSGRLPNSALTAGFVYVLYVLDRLSMQIGMVNAIYLRSIAIKPDEVTSTLSLGLSLDHLVTIVAAMAGGYVWSRWGSQWVFFLAAAFSLGNLFVAWRVDPVREQAEAQAQRTLHERGNA